MEKLDKHQLDVLNDSAKELSAAVCISKGSAMELILHILDIYSFEERQRERKREFAAAVSALESICKKAKAKSTIKNCKVKAWHPWQRHGSRKK